ncbi:hypothetical protein OIE71_04805 [Streptomyces sp. NBC_01725]|uniref:hypothetical protein n=1 Tax=Streptomyces sp. NBC_01725 TaxID=2975923 RepID=UPI002E29CFEB|nr:hypothetical protein [Streptomyces sp. NBC_01725]
MAQDSWPSPAHNSRAITDTEYEKLAARFSDDGVDGYPTDPPVVTAGVGLTVTIAANVQGSLRGHGWTSGTTPVTLTVAANSSGQTRTDRVVLRLDRDDWTVRAVIKTGTPGAGPPVLTTGDGYTTYEALLANVTVLTGANSITVTRGERYIGARIRPCTSQANTDPNPKPGDVTWETDTGRLRLYDGSSRRNIFYDSGVIGVNSSVLSWSNEVESVIQARNGTVHCRFGSFRRLASNLAAGDESRLPVVIPAAYRHPTRDQYGMAIVGTAACRFIVHAASTTRAGQVWLVNHPSIASGAFLLPMSGMSWAVD